MTDVQLQPDKAEVLQEEGEPLGTVPVCIEEIRAPVRVQRLPGKAGSTRTKTIGASAVQILGADKYRSSALLCSFDQDFLFAFSAVGASDPSTMSRQPKNVPLKLEAAVEVWVMAQTATTSLSITTERWATGE